MLSNDQEEDISKTSPWWMHRFKGRLQGTRLRNEEAGHRLGKLYERQDLQEAYRRRKAKPNILPDISGGAGKRIVFI